MQRPKGNVELKRQPLDLTKGFAISGDSLHLMAKIMKKAGRTGFFRVSDPPSNEIVFKKTEKVT